jgi:hypothetical protein
MLRRMKGQTDGLYPWEIISPLGYKFYPWGPTSPLRVIFGPGGRISPLPLGTNISLGCQLQPQGSHLTSGVNFTPGGQFPPLGAKLQAALCPATFHLKPSTAKKNSLTWLDQAYVCMHNRNFWVNQKWFANRKLSVSTNSWRLYEGEPLSFTLLWNALTFRNANHLFSFLIILKVFPRFFIFWPIFELT